MNLLEASEIKKIKAEFTDGYFKDCCAWTADAVLSAIEICENNICDGGESCHARQLADAILRDIAKHLEVPLD